jgi:hypothetical protein
MTQGAIKYSAYINIQKAELAICISLHGELDIAVNAVRQPEKSLNFLVHGARSRTHKQDVMKTEDSRPVSSVPSKMT